MINAGHQEIKCNVQTCKYNDKVNFCTLDNITVGNTSYASSAHKKDDTECVSFQDE